MKFRDYEPDQLYLLPPNLREWLPAGHLCYFISDLAEQLDLSAIYESYDGSQGGQPPYHPLLMVKLLFYAYCVGVPSSRKIEKKTYEDVAFRVLAAGEYPDHDTISAFRHRHLQSLAGLFIQVLQLCRRAGLVKLGHVVLDGTKVKANASRHKAMSYGRLQAKERELEQKVKELLKQAELVDAEEDRLYGKGIRGDELPEELRFHESRLKKIKELKASMEAEAEAKAEVKNQEIERQNPTDPLREKKNKGKKRRGRKFKPISAEPKASAQRNFTDPDSRMMLDNSTKAFIYGYNCQAAVDAHNQIIIATATTQAATDKNQLEPMLREIKKNVKIKPAKLSADAGYYSEANIKLLEKAKIDCYIPPDKQGHNQKDTPAPRGRPPDNVSTADRLRRKLKTVRGKKIYARRKEVVEPVFGQIKGARGLRQFLLRGSDKVSPEWDIWCLTHNVLKLFRSGWMPKFA
jgi:transposase